MALIKDANYFHPTVGEPLDNRLIVDSIDELYSLKNAYQGMIVTVLQTNSDESGIIYQLWDPNFDPDSMGSIVVDDANNWKRITLTVDQLNAVNSGITSDGVAMINSNLAMIQEKLPATGTIATREWVQSQGYISSGGGEGSSSTEEIEEVLASLITLEPLDVTYSDQHITITNPHEYAVTVVVTTNRWDGKTTNKEGITAFVGGYFRVEGLTGTGSFVLSAKGSTAGMASNGIVLGIHNVENYHFVCYAQKFGKTSTSTTVEG